MIDQLPEGESIGWMQAPPQWIFSHTVRFVGIVRVVIHDGEGFILIKKGKALVYYFKHGRIELRGHAALDYFNSQPTIEINLCKYTPEEFSEALRICNSEKTVLKSADVQKQAPIAPGPEGVGKKTVDDSSAIIRHAQSPPPLLEPSALIRKEPVTVVPAEPLAPVAERQVIPQPAILDDPSIKTIGQIKKLNGIVAISVFNDERNILLMGDVEIEPLLKIARSMLATANKISPHLDWGSFIHMTLQIPEGNIIIAPYHENHLCILTTRTINIGHIRRILRDIQHEKNPGVML
jgi:hypothetical protein